MLCACDRIALVVVSLVLVIAGCDFLGLSTYTVRIYADYDSTSIWDVKYRRSGTAEWTSADLEDDNGDSVYSVSGWDTDRPDIAYFDLPGTGTYDFAVYDVSDNQIDIITDQVVDSTSKRSSRGVRGCAVSERLGPVRKKCAPTDDRYRFGIELGLRWRAKIA